MVGLPSQCFDSLHELLNEKGMVLIPELFWNSCVKKPPRTSDNSELSANYAVFISVAAYLDAEDLRELYRTNLLWIAKERYINKRFMWLLSVSPEGICQEVQ